MNTLAVLHIGSVTQSLHWPSLTCESIILHLRPFDRRPHICERVAHVADELLLAVLSRPHLPMS